MRDLDAFYRDDRKGLLATYKAIVSFLPKKDGANLLRDYRPVSLANGAINFFDKVLSTRLADEWPKQVGVRQSAFIKCTTRRLHAPKVLAFLLKLDISMAFDSVQWPFLLEVLHRMGFGHGWRAWICGLLANSSTRMMVNGMQGKKIYNCRCLHQGDPLSLMLFILCMEPLQRLFYLATYRGIL